MKSFISMFLILALALLGGPVLAKSSKKNKSSSPSKVSAKKKTTSSAEGSGLVQGGDSSSFKSGAPSRDLALKDLKFQFARNLRVSHDDAFTDPAVGGKVPLPLGINVPLKEGGP